MGFAGGPRHECYRFSGKGRSPSNGRSGRDGGPGGIRSDAVCVRPAAVLRPADVRQDGAAATRWLAVRVGGVDVLLPGGAAGGLLLRARAEPLASGSSGATSASVRAGRRSGIAADRIAGSLVRTSCRRCLLLADRLA